MFLCALRAVYSFILNFISFSINQDIDCFISFLIKYSYWFFFQKLDLLIQVFTVGFLAIFTWKFLIFFPISPENVSSLHPNPYKYYSFEITPLLAHIAAYNDIWRKFENQNFRSRIWETIILESILPPPPPRIPEKSTLFKNIPKMLMLDMKWPKMLYLNEFLINFRQFRNLAFGMPKSTFRWNSSFQNFHLRNSDFGIFVRNPIL